VIFILSITLCTSFKLVGSQIGDIPGALKGKSRKGRKYGKKNK